MTDDLIDFNDLLKATAAPEPDPIDFDSLPDYMKSDKLPKISVRESTRMKAQAATGETYANEGLDNTRAIAESMLPYSAKIRNIIKNTELTTLDQLRKYKTPDAVPNERGLVIDPSRQFSSTRADNKSVSDVKLDQLAARAGFTEEDMQYIEQQSGGDYQKKEQILRELAENEMRVRIQNKERANTRLQTTEQSKWGKIGGGTVDNTGYTAEFAVGSALGHSFIAPTVGAFAQRYSNLRTPDYKIDKSGEVVVENEADGVGLAVGKALAGSVAETAVEIYTDKLLGGMFKLGGKLIGKKANEAVKEAGRATLRKMAGSAAGRAGLTTAKTYRNVAKWTGLNEPFPELVEEWIQDPFDNVLGLEKKSSEFKGMKDEYDEWKDRFCSSEYHLDILLGMLGTISVQSAGSAGYNKFRQSQATATDVGVLRSMGLSEETIKGLDVRDKKFLARIAANPKMTPEKAQRALRSFGNKVQKAAAEIAEQDGYDFDAQTSGIKSNFALPDVAPGPGEVYVDPNSQIGILEEDDGKVHVFNRDGRNAGLYDSVGDAVEAAHTLSKRNQAMDGRREQKAVFISNALERLAGDVDVVIHNNELDLLNSVPEIAESEDFAMGSPGLRHNGKVHLVLDNIQNPRDAISTILHEAGVHEGLTRILQSKKVRDAFLDNLNSEEVDGFIEFAQKLGYVGTGAEEALAYMYEKRMANPTGYNKAVKFLHDQIRKVNSNFNFTESDIEVMMADAQKSVQGHRGTVEFGDRVVVGTAQESAQSRANDRDQRAQRQAEDEQNVVDAPYYDEEEPAPYIAPEAPESEKQDRPPNRNERRKSVESGMYGDPIPDTRRAPAAEIPIEKKAEPPIDPDTETKDKGEVGELVKEMLRTDRIKESHPDLFEKALTVTDGNEEYAAGLVAEWLAGEAIVNKDAPLEVHVAAKINQLSDISPADMQVLNNEGIYGTDMYEFGYRREKASGIWKYVGSEEQKLSSTGEAKGTKSENETTEADSTPVEAPKIDAPESGTSDKQLTRVDKADSIKEPWQMTKKEYQESPEQELPEAYHFNGIVTAIREGKSVPAEVLADYPELQAKADNALPAEDGRKKGAKDFDKDVAVAADKNGKIVPIQEVPLDKIQLSKDVPNFKTGSSEATGEVDPIQDTKYRREGRAPIVLWERLNGQLEIITGRHRAALARRTGETTIPSQIFREADGFTKEMALTFDAESNIMDENGSVADYARYVRHTDITEKDAADRGILGRDKGRKGFAIGRYAEDDLYTLFANGKISETKAAAIAGLAPNNPGAQQAGMQYALGHNAEATTQFMRSILSVTPEIQQGVQTDLFQADTGWQDLMRNRAAAASRISARMKTELASLRAALSMSKEKRAEVVSEYGFKTGDVQAVQKRIDELSTQFSRFTNWHLNPDLVSQVAQEAGEKKASEPAPSPAVAPAAPKKNNGDLFAVDEMPFNLQQDTIQDPRRSMEESEKAKADSREAKKQRDAEPILPGIDEPAKAKTTLPIALAKQLLALSTESRSFPFGDNNIPLRRDIMKALTGKAVSSSKAGATAVRNALAEHFGIDPKGMSGGALGDRIESALRALTGEKVNVPTDDKPSLPAKSVKIMEDAIADKDTDMLLNKAMLGLNNKMWREQFEKATGVTLPKTARGTRDAVLAWAKPVIPVSVSEIDSAINTRARDNLMLKKGNYHVPGLRMSDQAEAGSLAYAVEKGESNIKEWNDYIDQTISENRFTDRKAPIRAPQLAQSTQQAKPPLENRSGSDQKMNDAPAPAPAPAPKKTIANTVKSLKDNMSPEKQARQAEIRAKLLKMRNRMNFGIDPEFLALGVEYTVNYIQAGVKTFKQYAEVMKSDLDVIWDELKDNLRMLWEKASDSYPELEEVSRKQAADIITALDNESEKDQDINHGGNNENVITADQSGSKERTPVRTGDRRSGSRENAKGMEDNAPNDATGTAEDGRSDVAPAPAGGTGVRADVKGTGRANAADGRTGGSGKELVPDRAGRTGKDDGGTKGNRKSGGDGRAPAVSGVQPNFRITDPETLVGGSHKDKFDRNKKALEIYNDVTLSNRVPTEQERNILASYIGWGSFGQELFNGTWDNPRPKAGWEAEDSWLREQLGEKGWKSAQDSIINAFYTDPPTVAAMWNMVRRMGFKGGRVLEPSMGVGNFFGMMPQDMAERSDLTGIELDSVTGGIAKMLYPQANISIKGYQESRTPDNFYDLIIGNWPFSAIGPADRRYNKLSPTLHDYFFLKALDQVRPGGLVVGITSTGTMDKIGQTARLEMSKKGELVASFRLPSGAFGKYAGTDVVTDIIVFRKFDTPGILAVPNWVGVTEVTPPSGKKIRINRYYEDNPKNIIGTLNTASSQYGPKMTVERTSSFPKMLGELSSRLPENIYSSNQNKVSESYVTNNTQERGNSVFEGADGKLYVSLGEHMALLTDRVKIAVKSKQGTKQRLDEIKALVKIRKGIGALVDQQRDGADTAEETREQVRKLYHKFVKQYGSINESLALKQLKKVNDPHYAQLASLERNIAKAGAAPQYVESAIFTHSTVRAKNRLANPTIKDAYVYQRNENLVFDAERIAELSHKPVAEVVESLSAENIIYQSPAGNFVHADEYLSGNVRLKLNEALAAKKEGIEGLDKNIEALKKVVPVDIPYYNIEAKLGNNWTSPEVYRSFVADMLGLPDGDHSEDITIAFGPQGWKVSLSPALHRRAEASSNFGTEGINFNRLVSLAMRNNPAKITYKDFDGNEVVDQERTALANEKIAKMKEHFSDWAWKDSERRTLLAQTYNESFNSIALPTFNGEFLTFDGMMLQKGLRPFDLRQHQVSAIARGLILGRGLYAHEVGTGKTFTMGGIAIESRRYGKAKKPLIFAHNANSATVAAEINEMYPGAKILYVDNLSGDQKKITLAQIVNDDWDAVVVPHSMMDKFSLRPETYAALAATEIAEMEAAALEAAEDDGVFLDVAMMDDTEAMKTVRSSTAKELVRNRARIKERIDKMSQKSAEDAIILEDAGIDMIIVDEAHEFKKPPIATSMKMKGLNTATSDKSINLMFLLNYINGINNGKGVHLFTGTPITNTLNEIYNMMRFIMPQEMKNEGVEHWDAWFNTFAAETTDVEVTPAGDYQPVSRLASFVNVPELRLMAGQFMDTVFAENMPEFVDRETASGKTMKDDLSESERNELVNGRTEQPIGRPYKIVKTIVSPMTDSQKAIRAELMDRANRFRNADGKERRRIMLSGDNANPVVVETDAAKAGLDARLYDMALEDSPISKTSTAIENVLEIYNSDPRTTQVIFMEKGYSDKATRTRKDAQGNKTTYSVPTFNLTKDITNRLIAGGIPANQIAIVNGSVSKQKRKAIADAMNQGSIRVVIGLTQTLGTGVNMQDNLRAIHHLDAPWKPGDLEQRNGRGHRQGNKWNSVYEFRYVTEGIDGRRWQVLVVKDRFIKNFFKSKLNQRVIEGDAAAIDDDSGGSDFVSTLAEATGDPRILQIEKAKKDVERLQRREMLYSSGLGETESQIRHLERRKEYLAKEIEARTDVEKSLDLVKDAPFSITIGGKTFAERKSADKALDAIKGSISSSWREPSTIGAYKGMKLSAYQSAYTERTATGEMQIAATYKVSFVHPNHTDVIGLGESGATVQGIDAALRYNKKHLESAKQESANNDSSRKRFEQALTEPFPQAAQLEATIKKLSDLESDLGLNPVPPPGWLRQGAPTGMDVEYNGETRVVSAHQWSDKGWFVVLDPVKEGGDRTFAPYTDVKDEQGIQIYEERPFVAPEIAKATKEKDVAAAVSNTRFRRNADALEALVGMDASAARDAALSDAIDKSITYSRLERNEIPQNQQKAYKLMQLIPRRDGGLFPLYAKDDNGSPQSFAISAWQRAEVQRPSIGGKPLANRPGIHAVSLPLFNQGKARVQGRKRVWVEVLMPAMTAATQAENDATPMLSNGQREGIRNRLIGPKEAYNFQTNAKAKGVESWPIAGSMMAARLIGDQEVETLLERAGATEYLENSLTGMSDQEAKALTDSMALSVNFRRPLKDLQKVGMYNSPIAKDADGKPVVRMTKAYMEVERERMGLDELPDADPFTNQEAVNAGLRMNRQVPRSGENLVAALIKSPRALEPKERGLMAVYHNALDIELQAIEDGIVEAQERGNLADVKASTSAREVVAEKLDAWGQANRASSRESGRSLQAIKITLREDYSLAAMIRTARADNGGKKVTEARYNELLKQFKKISAANKKMLAEIEKEADRKHQANLGTDIRRIRAEGKEVDAEEKYQQTLAKIDALSVENDWQDVPELPGLIRALVKYHVGEGIKELDAVITAVHNDVKDVFEGITPRNIRDIYSRYGKVTLLSQDEIDVRMRELTAQAQKVSAIEDVLNKLVPLKTGLQRDEQSQEVRELTKTLHRLMKEAGINNIDPARQQKSALDAVKTRLRNQIEDLDKALRTRTKIDATTVGVVYDEEAKALRDQRDALKADYDAIFSSPMTDAQRLEIATAAAEKSLDAWQARLDRAQKGDFTKEGKKPGVTPDARLTEIRDHRDAIKEEIKRLKDIAEPGLSPEEKAIRNRERQLQKSFDYYTNRLLNGDFAPKPKKELPVSEKIFGLLKEVEQAKKEYQNRRKIWLLDQKPVIDRVFTKVGIGLNNNVRSFLTSFDASAVGVQNAMLVNAHSVLAADAFVKMLQAGQSDYNAYLLNEELVNHPDYNDAVISGLSFLETQSDDPTHRAEEYKGSWAEDHIPGIKGSERMYSTFNNVFHMAVFSAIKNSGIYGHAGPTAKEKKGIAAMINIFGGRGDLSGEMKRHANSGSVIFWAPRLIISNLQKLVYLPNMLVRGGGSAKHKAAMTTEFTRLVASTVALTVLLNMLFGDDDDDIRKMTYDIHSALFMKTRIFNTTVDLTGGVASYMTFIANVLSATKTTITGRTIDLENEYGRSIKGEIGRFLSGKLSPMTGLLQNTLAREDFLGEPYGPLAADKVTGMKNMITSLITPLSLGDVYASFKENGAMRGMLLAPFLISGYGKSSYELDRFKIKANKYKDGINSLKEAKTAAERTAIRKSKPYLGHNRSEQINNNLSSIRKIEANIKKLSLRLEGGDRQALQLRILAEEARISKLKEKVISLIGEG